MYPRTIRNFNVFLDGVGYFGRAVEAKLPVLKIQTAAHRGGGMDAPLAVDQGMEAMQCSTQFMEWSPELYRQFGKRPLLNIRAGAVGERDFEADAFSFDIGGKLTSIDGDPLKAGPEAKLMLDWEVDFFRVELNGEELIKIDVENGIRIIGGEDQLASQRIAMGI